MLIQNQKKSVWWQFEDWLGLHYDPNSPKYWDAPKPDTPPQKARTPTKTTTEVVADNVKFRPQTGKWMQEIVGKTTDTNADNTPTTTNKATDNKSVVADKLPTGLTTNWFNVLTTPTNTAQLNTDRQPLLTSDDLKLIREKGLDEAKAQTIKDYWYKGMSRRKAAELLTATQKGYSDSIVKDYYTIFNKAIKEVESPTPEEK
jgi:hypothetical protein